MTKTDLEILIRNKFSSLFISGESLPIVSEKFNFNWARCSLSDNDICLLIETNCEFSPYEKNINLKRKSGKGPIYMEDVCLQENEINHFFIAIICRNRSLERLFERLVADLLINLHENIIEKIDPWERLKERLEGWRILFSFNENKSSEIGLIGELIIYKLFLKLSSNNRNFEWTGPLGATKDFMSKGFNCEVKTTTVKYGYFVHVNGLFQVRKDETIEKLAFIRIEERPNGEYSIKSLVNEIKSNMNDINKNKFSKLLSNFDTDILNSSTKYSILEKSFFSLDDFFPRISSESFKNNSLPNGIVKITWTADLSNLEKKNELDFTNEINELLC